MKTPEEWNDSAPIIIQSDWFKRLVKQIQADAKAEGWRQGMTDAAYCDPTLTPMNVITIIAARDAKGEK